MTQSDLYEYIVYLSNYRLNQLGVSSYEGTNPLEWMDWLLSGSKHDNFFEKKVTDYSHSGLDGSIDYSRYEQYKREVL